jgi:hypothetical protein
VAWRSAALLFSSHTLPPAPLTQTTSFRPPKNPKRHQILQLSINTRDEQMVVLEELKQLGITPGQEAAGPSVPALEEGDTPELLLQLLREAEAALGDARSSRAAGSSGSGSVSAKDEPQAGEQQQQQQQKPLARLPSGAGSTGGASAGGGAAPGGALHNSRSSSSLSGASAASGGGGGSEQTPLADLPLTQDHATKRYLAYMQDASKLLLEVNSHAEGTPERADAVGRLEVATRQLHDDMRGYAWARTSTAVRQRGHHITDPTQVRFRCCAVLLCRLQLPLVVEGGPASRPMVLTASNHNKPINNQTNAGRRRRPLGRRAAARHAHRGRGGGDRRGVRPPRRRAGGGGGAAHQGGAPAAGAAGPGLQGRQPRRR